MQHLFFLRDFKVWSVEDAKRMLDRTRELDLTARTTPRQQATHNKTSPSSHEYRSKRLPHNKHAVKGKSSIAIIQRLRPRARTRARATPHQQAPYNRKYHHHRTVRNNPHTISTLSRKRKVALLSCRDLAPEQEQYTLDNTPTTLTLPTA